MKKIIFAFAFVISQFVCCPSWAQTVHQVLDKCAAVVSAEGGVTANFNMASAQYGNAVGTISIKGQKFFLKSTDITMWFDGTTLWTYMAKNEEVNISTPTPQQLETLNPYNFINLYKKGYSASMTSTESTLNIHLSSTLEQHKIKEGFLTIDRNTYAPLEVKVLQNSKWSTFTISNLKTENLDDALFRFNASAYPDAEIIDLR